MRIPANQEHELPVCSEKLDVPACISQIACSTEAHVQKHTMHDERCTHVNTAMQ